MIDTQTKNKLIENAKVYLADYEISIKNKNKSAVIIEKDDSDRGISFGKLIENSSASNRSTNQDFKINVINIKKIQYKFLMKN